jgi:hypothetical protein
LKIILKKKIKKMKKKIKKPNLNQIIKAILVHIGIKVLCPMLLDL